MCKKSKWIESTQNKEEFLYKKTHIKTSGSSSGLAKDFTVGK